MLELQDSGARFLTCAKGAVHGKMAPEDGEPWVACYYLSCDNFYFRFQAVEREEQKKIGRGEILRHILTPYQHSDNCDSDNRVNDAILESFQVIPNPVIPGDSTEKGKAGDT